MFVLVRIVKNERSWAIELIGYINNFLNGTTLQIVRAGGETTINDSTRVMFPDVLLYGDVQQTQILQGWEVKLPDIPITDDKFIQDAQRKAETLGLTSTFIWNFTHGVLYTKDYRGQWQIERQWNRTSHIKTREEVETFRNDWENLIGEIILDLNRYFENGDLLPAGLGEIISESVMTTIISRNKEILAQHLERTASRNRPLGSALNIWWREIRGEYLQDERTLYGAFAKTVLLNWINRISFAHTIKHHHFPAMAVEEIMGTITPQEANEIFENISNQCDFYTVFQSQDYNDILPANTWRDLVEYNCFLSQQGITQYTQQSLQGILEKSVRTTKREIIGQFTTPPVLAEFLTRSVIEDIEGNIIDPCCGTGTIPKAALKLKKEVLSSENSHKTTWASDKFSFPLQIANIGLTDFNSISIPSRVFQSNVFNLKSGEFIEITNPEDGSTLQLEIPQFDAILSNLPFVPFEIISDDEKEHLRAVSSDILNQTGIELGKRSDLYTYIVAHLWSLVRVDGKIGIITSNSWLGTTSGREFYRVMRELFQIENVILSKNGRWFQNAAVVTTIIILRRKARIGDNETYNTSFSTLNAHISDLLNTEVMELAADSVLTGQNLDDRILTTTPYSQEEIDKLLELNVSINALFHNIDWLLDIEDKLINITEQFEVKRGERRGWDRMFYPEGNHGIESIYIESVLMNSRNLTTLQGSPDREAFCCSKSLEELEELGHYGAIRWIKRFENGVNNTGVPLTQSLRRSNHYWYEMKNELVADIVTTMNADKRLFYSKLNIPSFINQRLIGLSATANNLDLDLSHALLNSMIGMFYIEAIGFGRGLGALDLSKKNLQKAMMLNPELLSETDKLEIKEAFQPIFERDILSAEEELQQADRIYFEQTVLRAFGIENLFERMKSSILSMYKTRLTAKVR